MYFNAQNSKHKVFISFYHHDDEWYKEKVEDYFGDRMISKSVQDGEYDPDDSDGYVKRLIAKTRSVIPRCSSCFVDPTPGGESMLTGRYMQG